jgi:hypothetical protein
MPVMMGGTNMLLDFRAEVTLVAEVAAKGNGD